MTPKGHFEINWPSAEVQKKIILALKSQIIHVHIITIIFLFCFTGTELPDELSLRKCGVQNGDRLKLVLGMRGGPINMRRVALPSTQPKHNGIFLFWQKQFPLEMAVLKSPILLQKCLS